MRRMQIFLGGVSKPAEWRQKIAIPLLEEAGVTYLNPQVGHCENNADKCCDIPWLSFYMRDLRET
eukprot:419680-Pyramimonas_sp.AAC.3